MTCSQSLNFPREREPEHARFPGAICVGCLGGRGGGKRKEGKRRAWGRSQWEVGALLFLLWAAWSACSSYSPFPMQIWDSKPLPQILHNIPWLEISPDLFFTPCKGKHILWTCLCSKVLNFTERGGVSQTFSMRPHPQFPIANVSPPPLSSCLCTCHHYFILSWTMWVQLSDVSMPSSQQNSALPKWWAFSYINVIPFSKMGYHYWNTITKPSLGLCFSWSLYQLSISVCLVHHGKEINSWVAVLFIHSFQYSKAPSLNCQSYHPKERQAFRGN